MSDYTPYVPQLISPWEETTGAVGFSLAGAIIFADISGFTALSERLERKGQIGAEEVTEILDATFSRLLSAAYENGGSLLKFGGDALLIFFEGPMHAERAAHAAATMRTRLKEVGLLQSSAGSVRLRMSVGVHTGTFTLAVVGETHRELLIVGDGVTTTLELEKLADAGEILVSRDLAALLPANTLGEERGAGVLLKRIPPPPTQGLTPAWKRPKHAERFLSQAVRDHLGDGGGSEHRLVTVGFVKFTGTDVLARTAGQARVAELLHDLIGRAQQACIEEGTTFLSSDVDTNGGKFIIVGGAPLSRGDDADRTVRTLLRIVHAQSGLEVRAGVHVGKVFVGAVGPPFRRSYTIMGDAVNLGARLMARAEPGQVVASPEAIAKLRSRVSTTELEAFTPKGKSVPISPLEITGMTDTVAAARSSSLPLVGRDDELMMIMLRGVRLQSGRGACIELVGEPGIGKTRLVDEVEVRLADLATPPRIVRVGASQYESATPYALAGRLLRAVLGLHEDEFVTWKQLTAAISQYAPASLEDAALIADVTGTPVPVTQRTTASGETRQRLVHRAIGQLLKRSVTEPLAIIAEDFYWADEASMDLLETIASPAAKLPLLMVCTRRAGHRGLAEAVNGTQIQLGPLTDRASETFIRTATTEPLPPSQIKLLVERAGGHPLFLLELSRAHFEPGVENLPESVEAMIGARIDELNSIDRWVLRLSSVLGQRFDKALLPHLGADPKISDEQRWGNLTSFVNVTDTEVTFHHALYRDTAYAALPFRTRRELHARVAEAIESRTPDPDNQAAVLGLHFFRARTMEKAWHYLTLAAHQAHEKFANASAATFLRQAIEAGLASGRGKTADGRAELRQAWELLGDVLEATGDLTDAGKAYQAARRFVPGGTSSDPTLLTKEGRIRDLLGQPANALRWMGRARAAWKSIAGAPTVTYVRILLEEAAVYYRKGDNLKVADLCEEAITLASRSGLLPELARAYYLIHVALTTAGDPRRRDYRQLAIEVYEQLGDLGGKAKVLNNLGVEDYYDGNWTEALSYYRQCMAIEERLGLTTEVALSQANIAELLVDQGRWEEALELANLSLETSLAANYPIGILFARAMRGRALLSSHDPVQREDGLVELRRAIDGFEATDQLGQAREMRLHWARGLLEQGRAEESITELSALEVEVAKHQPESALAAMTKLVRGTAFAGTDRETAAELIDEALRLARVAGALHVIAGALRAELALQPDHPAAAEWQREWSGLQSSLGLVPSPSPADSASPSR